MRARTVRSVLRLRGFGIEATEEAAHGVGDGVGEVGGGRGIVLVLRARHGRREGCRADVEGGGSTGGWGGRGGRLGGSWLVWIGCGDVVLGCAGWVVWRAVTLRVNGGLTG